MEFIINKKRNRNRNTIALGEATKVTLGVSLHTNYLAEGLTSNCEELVSVTTHEQRCLSTRVYQSDPINSSQWNSNTVITSEISCDIATYDN